MSTRQLANQPSHRRNGSDVSPQTRGAQVELQRERRGDDWHSGLRDTRKSIKPELDMIEVAVGQRAAEFSHFHVCIFEWESGF